MKKKSLKTQIGEKREKLKKKKIEIKDISQWVKKKTWKSLEKYPLKIVENDIKSAIH